MNLTNATFRDEDNSNKIGMGTKLVRRSTGAKYIVALCDVNEVGLVNLETGNCLRSPREVENVRFLSRKDVNFITGNHTELHEWTIL